ncbi:MAG TPA: ribose 5-phosphate isomerase B [Ktedonobacterales bacterium]|nr:ribose 5-phosphate isomerase B [Ktedonobacterales bacterium]
MRVAIGVDHAGFPLKAPVIADLQQKGHEVIDLGGDGTDPTDDYPDYSKAVAHSVQSGQADRAVLICGSGVGASVAANKVRGVRAALCHDLYSARQGVEDDNINVLCLGARVIGADQAVALVNAYMDARFSGLERHARRLAKVNQMEEEFCQP